MNKNKIILITVASVALIGTVSLFIIKDNKSTANIKDTENIKDSSLIKNTTYIIENRPITLINGKSIIPVSDTSSSTIITEYFGNEIKQDFDMDGRMDTGFILTQRTGGSGLFYYFVAELNTASGNVGSHGYFIGDRIAPQSTEIFERLIDTSDVGEVDRVSRVGGGVTVNFSDRNPGESFTVLPSFAKSLHLVFDAQTLKFVGIKEPVSDGTLVSDGALVGKMSVFMKKWMWVNTKYSDGTNISPKQKDRFSINFKPPRNLEITTDCNAMGGEYIIGGNKIEITQIFGTLMACEGSQEHEYSISLGEARKFHFTSDGKLVLELESEKGKGEMVFK